MSIIYIKEVYSDDLSIILRVDGILDSTSISILKTACERHTNGKQKIELDLRKLIHINREGREFLKKIQQEGIRVEYPQFIGLDEKDSGKWK